ncbi:MAG: DeoR/GlpR family DNA-binding transcription regulator [Eubacteriales bacterium]
MLPGERRNNILEMLQINRSITVQSLCDTMAASEATIRRDLSVLENEGKLERTHGGAILSSRMKLEFEDSFYQKETQFPSQKRAIAKKAFEFLNENDSIVLDSGTTTRELARLIGQSMLHITVITNSTMLSGEISNNPNVALFVLGGKVRLNVLSSVGNIAIDTLRRFNVDKAFVAVNGLSAESGLTTPDIDEADVKRAMLASASERFVLADHSKFNRVAMCQIAPISMVDKIITDNDLEAGMLAQFETSGIQIFRA